MAGYPNRPDRHEGWAGGLHAHHDHGEHLCADTFRPGEPRRIMTFARTIICEQCNSTDGTIKRRLKLPKYFTFAPLEIRRFVIPTPHSKHIIWYETAEEIFHMVTHARHRKQKPTYLLRQSVALCYSMGKSQQIHIRASTSATQVIADYSRLLGPVAITFQRIANHQHRIGCRAIDKPWLHG